jgi:hypothetical protein
VFFARRKAVRAGPEGQCRVTETGLTGVQSEAKSNSERAQEIMDTIIQVPDTISSIIGWILWAFLGAAALWAVLSVMGYWHRRAYNLTQAESVRSRDITPDFLRVDQKKRDELIAKGKEFDAKRDSPPTGVSRANRTARVIVFVTALFSFLTAAAAAMLKVGEMQRFYEQYSSLQRFVAIVMDHKFGFATAGLVILFDFALFLARVRGEHRP